ncbi:hypothetical protein [Asaia sp. HN010]|uniref:hypothetical protein n=1 Tax=Asaia sp. HN010 TaxID=3081233 RepID=UPI0030182653
MILKHEAADLKRGEHAPKHLDTLARHLRNLAFIKHLAPDAKTALRAAFSASSNAWNTPRCSAGSTLRKAMDGAASRSNVVGIPCTPGNGAGGVIAPPPWPATRHVCQGVSRRGGFVSLGKGQALHVL